MLNVTVFVPISSLGALGLVVSYDVREVVCHQPNGEQQRNGLLWLLVERELIELKFFVIVT